MNRLWYVAYGSNLASSRFDCYLLGGRPLDGRRSYPGCRDATRPAADRAVQIPGAICFIGVSTVWGGGTAVYRAAHPRSQVAGRAYLLTAGQLSDIAAQEMHRVPGTDLDLHEFATSGSHRFGPGRYETLLRVGVLEGHPMATLTASRPFGEELNAPSAAYLRVTGEGLRETHGWTAHQVGEYLAAAPGARGVWSADAITELIDATELDHPPTRASLPY